MNLGGKILVLLRVSHRNAVNGIIISSRNESGKMCQCDMSILCLARNFIFSRLLIINIITLYEMNEKALGNNQW